MFCLLRLGRLAISAALGAAEKIKPRPSSGRPLPQGSGPLLHDPPLGVPPKERELAPRATPQAQAALPEWQRSRGGPPRQTPCPNTCAQEGRAIFKERARKEADLVSGIKTRKALIETAKREAVDAGKELETVRAQLPQLEEAEQKAKAAVDAAKEKARAGPIDRCPDLTYGVPERCPLTRRSRHSATIWAQ